MAFVPIAASEIAFTFQAFNDTGSLTMAGSSVVGVDTSSVDGQFWQVNLTNSDARVRITTTSFESADPFASLADGALMEVTMAGDNEFVMAQTATTVMTPSQYESPALADAIAFYAPVPGVEGTDQCSFQFLIEVDVDIPPPVVVSEPYIIRNTARVYRGALNNVKAWIRTEEGKLDLSAFTTLEAVIWSGSGGAFRDGYTPGAWMWPNSGQNLLFTVPVTSPELGLALFQLPPSGNTLRWIPSSLCYTILGDGVPLATGLIEVVG